MTHSSRWLLVLGLSVMMCGTRSTCARKTIRCAVERLGGQQKPANNVKKPQPKPARLRRRRLPKSPLPLLRLPHLRHLPLRNPPQRQHRLPSSLLRSGTRPRCREAGRACACGRKTPLRLRRRRSCLRCPRPLRSRKSLTEQPAAATRRPPQPMPTMANLVSELLTLETIRRKSSTNTGMRRLEVLAKPSATAIFRWPAISSKQVGLHRQSSGRRVEARRGRPRSESARRFIARGQVGHEEGRCRQSFAVGFPSILEHGPPASGPLGRDAQEEGPVRPPRHYSIPIESTEQEYKNSATRFAVACGVPVNSMRPPNTTRLWKSARSFFATIPTTRKPWNSAIALPIA
jgi:hypothetical protein